MSPNNFTCWDDWDLSMIAPSVLCTSSFVFVTAVSGAVGGVKAEVYMAVPFTIRKSAILPST